MTRRQLTPKQTAFFRYVQTFVDRNGGAWPTYRELVDYFGYRSPNSVTQNLQALVRKGVLERDGEGYRIPGQAQPGGIPVRGIISAGRLQEAVEANLGTITMETLFPNLNRLFALRVSGRSMVGADIHDGDYVLLVDDDIPQGGIGAVLYNGETSLKRIYMEDGGLRLEPCNDEFETIQVAPDIFEEVRILGRYVGHVNRTGIRKVTGTGMPKAA
jgi:repressor LexA